VNGHKNQENIFDEHNVYKMDKTKKERFVRTTQNKFDTKLFEQLITSSGVEIQNNDNIFVVDNESLDEFYHIYDMTHEDMLNYPGLARLIENHVVDFVEKGNGKNTVSSSKIRMISGSKFDYIPGKIVDNLNILGDSEKIFYFNDLNTMDTTPQETKVRLIVLDGMFLIDEKKLKEYASSLKAAGTSKSRGFAGRPESYENAPLEEDGTQFFHGKLSPTTLHKNSSNVKLPLLDYGSISARGSMEHENEDRIHEIETSNVKINLLFDGHGGAQVADELIKQVNEFFPLKDLLDGNGLEKKKQQAIELFKKIDERFRNYQTVGSTCVIAVHDIIKKKVVFLNLGDSRAIWWLSVGSVNSSRDHKPGDPQERSRIVKMGGSVQKYDTERVGGRLAVSGGFGDFDLKPYVRINPDIYGPYDAPKGSVYVLASDGIVDVLSNEEIVSVVKRYKAQDAAVMLEKKARSAGSSDDMSVIVAKVL